MSIDCKKKYETPSPFTKIRKLFKCGVFFSPGGPIQRWKKGQLLGVGHVKYKWSCKNAISIPKKVYKHPQDIGGLVYAMFFYVIEDKPPFRILYYSNGFIPGYKDQRYALVFPMACVNIEKDLWAISYGEGDDTPNVLYVDSAFIQKQLISVDAPQKPENYSISWLPSNKI